MQPSVRRAAVVVFAVALVAASAAWSASPAGSAPFCGITWGSLERIDYTQSGSPITAVRAGRHDCFDRVVFDIGTNPDAPSFLRPVPGYDVQYLSAADYAARTGGHPPPAGGAVLYVLIWTPFGYQPCDPNALVPVGGFATLRQVAFLSSGPGAGSGESITALAIGVRARLPFRVLTLGGPGTGSRLVVDVAHRW